ncbi:hypothetical protein AAG570_010849 [Ranatra chinensis]|uniref:Uncharacterized protein n=1 Tax=Ranatra chinensis TaxID=642074 RepID=A0ABD0YIW0_9HEMI
MIGPLKFPGSARIDFLPTGESNPGTRELALGLDELGKGDAVILEVAVRGRLLGDLLHPDCAGGRAAECHRKSRKLLPVLMSPADGHFRHWGQRLPPSTSSAPITPI